jgi:integrase
MAVELKDLIVQRAKCDDCDEQGNLKPKYLWDTLVPGFALRVTPQGRKKWILNVRLKPGEPPTRRTVGQWPTMSLADARTKAGEWYEAARQQGKDPRRVEAEKREGAERERREAQRHHEATLQNTFGNAAAAYLANCRKLGHRHVDKDKAEIERHLLRYWRDKPLASFTKTDVGERLKAIAPTSAYNVFGQASRIFDYAIDGPTDYGITASPFDRLTPKALGLKKNERERVLDEDEIIALWRATSQLDYPEQHFYRWLLLTGCRRGDAQLAHRREFNLARKTWTIPAERFKSKRAHVLPLTDDMLALLNSVSTQNGWVFTHDGEKPMNGFGKSKRRLDDLIGDAITEPWQNHDLRRVVRSHMAALKVPDNIAEMVAGRGRKGIQRVYDRYGYLAEMRDALTKWNARLAELIR